MLRNFDLAKWLNPRAPMGALRLGAAALLAANLAAAFMLIYPVGGSPEELREELATLREQMRQQRGSEEHLKAMAGKVQTGREQGTQFLNAYFLERRSAYRSVLNELVDAANEAGIQPKETSFSREPVEGTDALDLMKVTANYQGTYANLLHFINRLDKSKLLLIIEGLQATPQQQTGVLNVSFKLDAFIRPDGNAVEIAGHQNAEAGDRP
ncbi:MAG TPA: hypothetical protein VHD76_04310 [Bryobacteraceae bacterium]|jgi:hypothetical protein|nr:hypothetical protein [Bryobacteraceae bacterium]